MNAEDTKSFYRYPPQNHFEFEALCQRVRELQPSRILEIGSRHGRSIVRLAEAAMPALERVTILDLPGHVWGADSEKSLRKAAAHLESRKIAVDLWLMDSHSDEATEQVSDLEFDFAFLDGDHTLKGVSQDFDLTVSRLAPGGMVALHDIAAPDGFGRRKNSKTGEVICVEVPIFWRSLKDKAESDQIEELIAPNSKFGIGIFRPR